MQIKYDSRDWGFHHFGQATELPDNYEVKLETLDQDDVQPIGDVRCTVFSVSDVHFFLTGERIDKEELWARTPHYSDGADPRETLKQAIKGVTVNGQLKTPYTSFYRADTGSYSSFDNVRSAIMVSQRPVIMWSMWRYTWGNTYFDTVGRKTSGHCFVLIAGWQSVGGLRYFKVFAHDGRWHFFPESVFNQVMKEWTSGTAILSDKLLDLRRDKTTLESIGDQLKNLAIQVQNLAIAVQEFLKKKNNMKNIYDVSKSLLGYHLTLDNSVDKMYGCAEAVSKVLSVCGYNIPKKGIAGTAELDEWLASHGTLIDAPKQGCIIISPTVGDNHGHVGVLARFDYAYPGDWGIMSNNSQSGLFNLNWSYREWIDYYQNEKGLQVKIYEL